MKVEILGSGGAITTPVPLCQCRVCEEARKKGAPYSRTGPSVFIHGPNILIDTPEEIKEQINRSNIESIEGCFYSHWHPDHVAGLRVWETMNKDFQNHPPIDQTTNIYLPEQVHKDFKKMLGYWTHFSYLQQQNVVKLHLLFDDEAVQMNGAMIKPFRLAEDYVYAFLIEKESKRILIASDELNGWDPPSSVLNIDLAVLPIGVVEVHPLTGIRHIQDNHPVLDEEATFEETFTMVKKMSPKKTVLTHIEEPDGITYDDLKQIEAQLNQQGLNIQFAYDTMLIDV